MFADKCWDYKIFFFVILVCGCHFIIIWMLFLLITMLSFFPITDAFILIIYINVKLLRKVTISCDIIKALHRWESVMPHNHLKDFTVKKKHSATAN